MTAITPETDQQASQAIKDVVEAVRAGADSRAYELATAALDRGVQHPMLYNVRATRFWHEGLYQEALADLRLALPYTPNNPMLWDRIGNCLLRLGEWSAARTAFESAIAGAPNFALAHYRRGLALQLLGERAGAKVAHGRALQLKPDFAEAVASLALISVGEGNFANARAEAERALAIDPHQPTAQIARVMADLRSGDVTAAVEGLEKLVREDRFGDDPQANNVLGMIADALDEQGNLPLAFEVVTALHRKRREIHGPRFARASASEQVARLGAYFEKARPWQRPANVSGASGAAAGHIFLLGFARSGTTLLETILASNARVSAMDERDCFPEPAKALLTTEAGVERLATLDGSDLVEWRHAYWQSVRKAGVSVDDKVFVDKWPFNSYRLPLIARLFPDAKILLALRDPRDVVLSCFRRRFVLNADTFEFLTLEGCARFYAQIMNLLTILRPKLPLPVHEHRYEHMIADFDSAVRAVCEFIGIAWDQKMRNFSGAAEGTLHPLAQSGRQVRRGLYTSGMGQWHRYRAQLEPALPILEPWIEHFGYPAS